MLSTLTSDDYMLDPFALERPYGPISSSSSSSSCCSSYDIDHHLRSSSIDTYEDDGFFQDSMYSNRAYGCMNYHPSYDYDDEIVSPAYYDFYRRRNDSYLSCPDFRFLNQKNPYFRYPPPPPPPFPSTSTSQGIPLFDTNSFGESRSLYDAPYLSPYKNHNFDTGEMIRHQSFPLDNRSMVATNPGVSEQEKAKKCDVSPQQSPSEEIREPKQKMRLKKVPSASVIEAKGTPSSATYQPKQRRVCVKKVVQPVTSEKPGNPDDIDPVGVAMVLVTLDDQSPSVFG